MALRRLSIFTACTVVSFASGGMSFAQIPSYRPNLGIRISQVTDEIAHYIGEKEPHGALVIGVDDKGPAKSAGIEPGDLVVKIDGRDIAEASDASRVVAGETIGKDVPVVIIHLGQEETKTVRVRGVALPRTPTCDELSRLAEGTMPRGDEIFFGKRREEMNSSDFDRAIGAVSQCQEAVKAWPRSLHASVVTQNLSSLKYSLLMGRSQQLPREQSQRAQDEAV